MLADAEIIGLASDFLSELGIKDVELHINSIDVYKRQEWKFGVASIVGVAHDVLMVIAFYAIFRVTVNNPFIAGILTVVGYSINDTIVAVSYTHLAGR